MRRHPHPLMVLSSECRGPHFTGRLVLGVPVRGRWTVGAVPASRGFAELAREPGVGAAAGAAPLRERVEELGHPCVQHALAQPRAGVDEGGLALASPEDVVSQQRARGGDLAWGSRRVPAGVARVVRICAHGEQPDP